MLEVIMEMAMMLIDELSPPHPSPHQPTPATQPAANSHPVPATQVSTGIPTPGWSKDFLGADSGRTFMEPG